MIHIQLQETETELFCSSKWWGDPDLPRNMGYPMISVEEDGESYRYPLTFICQIDCEDLAPLDPDGLLPHQGMLYFFAALDEYAGYDSPVHNGPGPWDKGMAVVRYAPEINFETFRASMLVDDEDNSLTEPARKLVFGEEGASSLQPEEGILLRIADGTGGLNFEGRALLFRYNQKDFQRDGWKSVHACLE